MIINAYTLYDRKAFTYSPPFFAITDGVAVRMVQNLVADTATSPGQHPNDYVLYRAGGYDDQSGRLLPLQPLEHVIDCQACVARQSPLPFDPQPGDAARAAGITRTDPVTEEVKFNGSGV